MLVLKIFHTVSFHTLQLSFFLCLPFLPTLPDSLTFFRTFHLILFLFIEFYFFSFPFLSTVWGSDKWRGHCSFCTKGGSWKMLAPSVLCLRHMRGSIGGPHILPPGWQDLLWPAPCREAETPLLCLWWGAPVWAWSPLGLEMAEWFMLTDLDGVGISLEGKDVSVSLPRLRKSAVIYSERAWIISQATVLCKYWKENFYLIKLFNYL